MLINQTRKNKKETRIINLAALTLFIIGMLAGYHSKAQTKSATPTNLYAITGNGLKDTSWLFGTYHLIKDSYLKEVQVVNKVFKKAKEVVVEIVIDSSKLMAAYASGMMLDKKLTDLLDKPFSDSLDVELKATLGAGLEQLNPLKPMNIMVALSITYLMKENESMIKKYTGKPLDVFFAEQGKQTGKSITALETIEEQMDVLFNKTSLEEQISQLKSFIRTKNENIKSGNELMNSWFAHDLNKMYKLSEDAMKLYGGEEDLIKNRNDNWMKKLPGIVGNQSTFIAVGALHLPGKDGLIKQLQQKGYTLTPIKL
jgi:uncharacterized protein YbaP (TraB family)